MSPPFIKYRRYLMESLYIFKSTSVNKSGPDGIFFLNPDMQILTFSGVILP